MLQIRQLQVQWSSNLFRKEDLLKLEKEKVFSSACRKFIRWYVLIGIELTFFGNSLQPILFVLLTVSINISEKQDLMPSHRFCLKYIMKKESMYFKGFSYFQKAYSAKNTDEEEVSPALKSRKKLWNKRQWQQSLLQPIIEMIKIKYGDVRESLLNLIFKLLQNNGHEFNSLGFISIIKILELSCEDGESQGHISVGFHILETIVGQYLHVLDPQVTQSLLPLIKNFKAKTTEQNISYISVGLVWQIADNLAKICSSEDQSLLIQEQEELWRSVLFNLKDLCLDGQPDVRQSALHIIIQIILINCSSFRIDFQIDILRNVIECILDALIGRVAQLAKMNGIFHSKTPRFLTNDQTPKFTKFSENELNTNPNLLHEQSLWEETLKLMVQNLSKILKKLTPLPDFQNYSQEVHDELFVRLFIMFRINSLDLKLEIMKLIKENLEMILQEKIDKSMEWSKELMSVLNEFLFQKISDNKDVKTFINKLLPEICECFTMFLQGYRADIEFYEEFLDEFFYTYQQIIEQPIKIENIANIKIWMDEKHLHDYIDDFTVNFQEYSTEIQIRLLKLLLNNISKPGAFSKIQDMLILKYCQVFSNIVTSSSFILMKEGTHLESDEQRTFKKMLMDYVKIVTNIFNLRKDEQILSKIKVYNKMNQPIWINISLAVQKVFKLYHGRMQELSVKEIMDEILVPARQNLQYLDSFKSCIDFELQWCEWIWEQKQEEFIDLVLNYWQHSIEEGVPNGMDEVYFEARGKLIKIYFSMNGLVSQKMVDVVKYVCGSIILQYLKDEQMTGNMPLSRKRVQEIVQILQEMLKLRDLEIKPHPFFQLFDTLTELIVAKDQEIKQPLQVLFKEIGKII